MCKPNFIHVCFIIDESGSMYGSESDIIGGFNKTIEEQKSVKDGQCSVSFFSFDTNVRERFIGKDVNDVKKLTKGNKCSFRNFSISTSVNSIYFVNDETDIAVNATESESDSLYQYSPDGGTAMNDAIASAINKIGKWLSDMP